jgi:hypothetical protein
MKGNNKKKLPPDLHPGSASGRGGKSLRVKLGKLKLISLAVAMPCFLLKYKRHWLIIQVKKHVT